MQSEEGSTSFLGAGAGATDEAEATTRAGSTAEEEATTIAEE